MGLKATFTKVSSSMGSGTDVAFNGTPTAINTTVVPYRLPFSFLFLAGEWINGDRHGNGVMYICETNSYYDCAWIDGQVHSVRFT